MNKLYGLWAGALAIVSLSLMLAGCPHELPVKIYGDVCLTPYKNYTYEICEDLLIEINHHPIIVPLDFKTDLASIPRTFWSIYSPAKTEYILPAIVHDYLYTCEQTYSREQADNIFYNLLVKNNVPYFRAYLFYCGTRLFGEKYYHVGCTDNL